MTIKSSGSLNTTEIVAEWGGSQPNSLSEYYSGGSLVYSGAEDGSGNDIPSSGNPISFSDFYDTTAFAEPGSYTTVSSSTTATVTAGANAIIIYQAVGGGGEGLNGLGYDKAGAESSGPGGGAGGFVSEKVFSVTAGETITFTIGAGGSGKASNASYSSDTGYRGNDTGFGILWGDTSDAVSGGTTTVSGSSTGTLITLAGGGGATNGGGGVQGPIRSQGAGSGGSATINATALTSGTTSGGTAVSSFANSSGSGNDGVGGNATNNSPGNHFGGDNTNGAGGNGGASQFASGGAGDSSGSTAGGGDGSQGSGGGGGSALGTISSSLGGEGGDGFVSYKFLQVN